MLYVHLVALTALLEYLVFSTLVGRARGRYGVQAPAVTGHLVFERFYRVQMNTLELLVVFLPVLWLAGTYWSAPWSAALGGVYLIGRALYAAAYVRNPAARSAGFMLSMVPIGMLWVAAVVGLLRGPLA
jgi:glutathione S-transferase